MLWIEHTHASILKGEWRMDAGSDHDSAAEGSAIDLEVTGSGPFSCCFLFPPLSLPCVVPNHYLIFHWYHHGT